MAVPIFICLRRHDRRPALRVRARPTRPTATSRRRRTCLRRRSELNPGFAAAWFALGEMREKLGDRAGAIAAFERREGTDP